MAQSSSLPSKAEFIAHHVTPTSDIDSCGICLEELGLDTDDTVALAPCGHIFCRVCIQSWFDSSRPERDTCPTCRRVLFTIEPLTPEQIARLKVEYDVHGAPRMRALGPYRPLRPDETLEDWEKFTSDNIAREAIELEVYRSSLPGQASPNWVSVTVTVAIKIYTTENGRNNAHN